MSTTASTNNVRQLREERLLTQAELAARISLTQACVSAIERGTRAGRWRTRRRIAAALDFPLEQVFPSENATRAG
jgi:DNA-binding XRE family transcriptional regulator